MVDAPAWWRDPMLCKTIQREELDDHAKWRGYTAEPKHDGARCLVVSGGGGARLYSRSGQDWTDHAHPDLLADLGSWVPRDSIVDGELAIIERTFDLGSRRVPVADFNATMRVLGSGAERGRNLQPGLGIMSLIAYDIPKWDGAWHVDAPQSARRAHLKRAFPSHSQRTFLNPSFTDHSRFGELFDTLVEHKVEGVIVKNGAAGYLFDGRPNKTWYKVKAAITLDMVVMGFTDGGGKYEGLIGAIKFGRWTPDGVVFVAQCSGMTDALRKEISADRDSFLGRVIEVKSNELVGRKEHRTPRHPQFIAFRADKRPEDCLGDELRQS